MLPIVGLVFCGFHSYFLHQQQKSVANSCFPFGQKNCSELLLSLKPHVPFARNGGHHAHWFYRSLSPQGPPFVQGRVAQTCILTTGISTQSSHILTVPFITAPEKYEASSSSGVRILNGKQLLMKWFSRWNKTFLLEWRISETVSLSKITIEAPNFRNFLKW
jgi:hypothetical protein